MHWMVSLPKMFPIHFLVFILAVATTRQTHITSHNSFQTDPLISPHLSSSHKSVSGGKKCPKKKKSSTSVTSLSNKSLVSLSEFLHPHIQGSLYHVLSRAFSSRLSRLTPQEEPSSQSHLIALCLTYPVIPYLAIFVPVISSARNSLQTQSSC